MTRTCNITIEIEWDPDAGEPPPDTWNWDAFEISDFPIHVVEFTETTDPTSDIRPSKQTKEQA
jgi:hypothetical protein